MAVEGAGKSSSVRRSEPPAEPKAKESESKNEAKESNEVQETESKHEVKESTEIKETESRHEVTQSTEIKEDTTTQDAPPRDEFVEAPNKPKAPVDPQDAAATPGSAAPPPAKAQNESPPRSLTDYAQHQPEVAKLVQEGKLRETMDATLNSEGDNLTLKLGVQGTAGEGVNVGAGVGSEAKLTRTKEGYELTVQGEAKGLTGAELSQGTEATLEGGLAVSPKFKFNTADEVQRGLEALGRSGSKMATDPTSLLGDLAMDAGTGALENGARGAAGLASNVPVVGNSIARGLNGVADGAESAGAQYNAAEDLNYLRQHLSSVTVQGAAAGELAANLGLPGVQLSNFGAQGSAKAQRSQSLEIELGPPAAATYEDSVQAQVKANVGLQWGAAADFTLTGKSRTKAELDQNVDMMEVLRTKKLPSANPVKTTESTTSLELNTRYRDMESSGISIDTGGGIKASVTVDNLKNPGLLDRALTPDAMQSALTGDLKPALRNVGDASVDTKAELYGTSGVNVLIGAGIAGTGVKVEGEARWEDMLQTRQMTVSGNQAADALQWLEGQVRGAVDEENFQPFPASRGQYPIAF
jgi:hypothetical protein